MNKKILVADIGGTNANFALVDVNLLNSSYSIIFKKSFSTISIKNFNKFLLDFFSKNDIDFVDSIILGVAGKIESERVLMSNRNLKISLKNLKRLGLSNEVFLMNDLRALAYSIDVLRKKDFEKLSNSSGKREFLKKKVLVVGVGTGFGMNFVIYESGKKIFNDSEVGHIGINEEVVGKDFYDFLLEKGSLEVEDVLSGKGIENIYSYIVKDLNLKKSKKAVVISNEKDKYSIKTFELFYIFLARFLRNLSLEFLPNEIYVGGGIVAKNLSFDKEAFLKEFLDNKKFNDYLGSVSIKILKNYDLSLLGLINYYFELRKRI